MNGRIQELAEQYLSGELSAAERDELSRLLDAPADRRAFAEHLQWSAMLARGALQMAGRMADLRQPAASAAGVEAPPPPARPSARRGWLWAGGGALAAAAALILALGAPLWRRPAPALRPAAPAAIAMLSPGSATATVVRNGESFHVGRDAPLYSGDVLELSGGGVAIVRYQGENTFVRLQSGTQATFSKLASGSKHIHLLRGRIAACVALQPDETFFQLTSLHAKATVLGTRFAMAVNEERALLGVAEGSVRFGRLPEGGGGGAVVVPAGHSSRASAAALEPPLRDPDFAGSLRGHWAFDDLGGRTAVDSSMEFRDGLVHGARWARGMLGGALVFAGGADRVEIPCPGLPPGGTNAWTLSLWVLSSGTNRAANLLAWRDAAGNGCRLTLDQAAGILALGRGADRTTGAVCATPAGRLGAGRWHHVLATIDPARGRLALAVDGRLAGEAVCAALPEADVGDAALAVGGLADGSQGFAGCLDDVRIYAGALPAGDTTLLRAKADNYPKAPAGTTIFVE